MALINLHNHSSYSDGTLKPAALALEAARAGIEYFSLTDHDTTDGWADMEPALKAARIKYCYGVEISTSQNGNLHILGYGMSPADPGLATSLAEFRERRATRIKKMVLKLNALGVNIAFEDLKPRGGVSPGRGQLAELLVQRNFAPDIPGAFARYLLPGTPTYERSAGPGVEEAIRVIKKAGGKAVIAHPEKVNTNPDFAAMKEAGLDGIEVFYPTHDKKAESKLLGLAAKYGLFVTAGGDFHGPPFERCVMTGIEFPEEHFTAIKDLFL